MNLYEKTIKDEFMKNNIFLLKMDITTDLAGSFDYKTLKNYLIDTKYFEFDGDNTNIKPYNYEEIE